MRTSSIRVKTTYTGYNAVNAPVGITTRVPTIENLRWFIPAWTAITWKMQHDQLEGGGRRNGAFQCHVKESTALFRSTRKMLSQARPILLLVNSLRFPNCASKNGAVAPGLWGNFVNTCITNFVPVEL
ncbi:hypothetical protein P879_01150 [Paragonimus westermani]|uniref:Uncharacterized protein n=1 Tax=Paragonimus westermani TaxID=34504 RepID=A0A8T0DI43_9TREM|nr:hypothetical protein P879_01150 [Paragonimus westermani]